MPVPRHFLKKEPIPCHPDRSERRQTRGFEVHKRRLRQLYRRQLRQFYSEPVQSTYLAGGLGLIRLSPAGCPGRLTRVQAFVEFADTFGEILQQFALFSASVSCNRRSRAADYVAIPVVTRRPSRTTGPLERYHRAGTKWLLFRLLIVRILWRRGRNRLVHN